MVGKVILSICVLALMFVASQVVEQKIAPGHAADLAIQAVNNPDTGAQAQLRIEQNAQNLLDPFIYASLVGMLIWIWLPQIKMGLKALTDSEKS